MDRYWQLEFDLTAIDGAAVVSFVMSAGRLVQAQWVGLAAVEDGGAGASKVVRGPDLVALDDFPSLFEGVDGVDWGDFGLFGSRSEAERSWSRASYRDLLSRSLVLIRAFDSSSISVYGRSAELCLSIAESHPGGILTVGPLDTLQFPE